MLVTLIDDDEAVRESLPDLVKVLGYAVSAFSSAQDFLASDVVDRTDCLVLDVNMPGMGGLQLLRVLKDSRKNIPVVLITVPKDEADRARLLALGARACLFKPFDDTALHAALKAALGQN